MPSHSADGQNAEGIPSVDKTIIVGILLAFDAEISSRSQGISDKGEALNLRDMLSL
jgi:hypothetical protein